MTHEEIEKTARQYPTYLEAYKRRGRNTVGPYYEDVHYQLRQQLLNDTKHST